MNTPHDSALGRGIAYPDRYDAGLLFPIARATQRSLLGIGDPLPFHGVDVWNLRFNTKKHLRRALR